jgi:hypothetical protein
VSEHTCVRALETPALNWGFRPVTHERGSNLVSFSESHGKFRYCSCMRWRMRSTEFQRSTKEDRIAAMDGLVRDGFRVGVLAYTESSRESAA